jgi:hypothetical protein
MFREPEEEKEKTASVETLPDRVRNVNPRANRVMSQFENRTKKNLRRTKRKRKLPNDVAHSGALPHQANVCMDVFDVF